MTAQQVLGLEAARPAGGDHRVDLARRRQPDQRQPACGAAHSASWTHASSRNVSACDRQVCQRCGILGIGKKRCHLCSRPYICWALSMAEIRKGTRNMPDCTAVLSLIPFRNPYVQLNFRGNNRHTVCGELGRHPGAAPNLGVDRVAAAAASARRPAPGPAAMSAGAAAPEQRLPGCLRAAVGRPPRCGTDQQKRLRSCFLQLKSATALK